MSAYAHVGELSNCAGNSLKNTEFNSIDVGGEVTPRIIQLTPYMGLNQRRQPVLLAISRRSLFGWRTKLGRSWSCIGSHSYRSAGSSSTFLPKSRSNGISQQTAKLGIVANNTQTKKW